MSTTRKIADELFAQMERLKPSAEQFDNMHQKFRRVINQFDHPGPRMQNITNFNVPDSRYPIPVRLYEPFGALEGSGPVLVFIHGGGFVACSVDTHEGICLRMANGSGFRVLSVDYRLAPEYPYPAGPDDCEKVLKWVLDGYGEDYGLSRQNVGIGGDSAGGNMSAYLAQKYRKDLKCQILYYPLMQLVELKPAKPGPQDILPLGFMALKFIDEHYVQNANPQNTRLSPLFEQDLKGLPPAYLLTCGLDPLRIEGKAYAEKLRAAGVKVTDHYEKTLPHGFLNFAKAFPQAKKVPLDAADFMRKYMST